MYRVPPCPHCNSDCTSVLETKKVRNGTRRRRHECNVCAHRWTSWDGPLPGHGGGNSSGNPVSRKPPIERDQIREILLSTESNHAIARRLNRSPETVRQIRLGIIHASVHPEIARRDKPAPIPKSSDGPSCYGCTHWSDRCGFGFPDPQIEGPAFAADCDLYAPA
jgi:hypothetical protein